MVGAGGVPEKKAWLTLAYRAPPKSPGGKKTDSKESGMLRKNRPLGGGRSEEKKGVKTGLRKAKSDEASETH